MREREINQLERKEPNELKTQPSNNLKIVLNLVDTLLAGKRFAEMDSKKQMYLMSCQTKVREMQEGHFDENGILFIYDTINSFIDKLTDAKEELWNVYKRSEEGER